MHRKVHGSLRQNCTLSHNLKNQTLYFYFSHIHTEKLNGVNV